MRQLPDPCFGTAYYPESCREDEWASDLRAMRAAGIEVVRWGEFSWSWWEPEPGRFDFAATDRFVDAVGRAGLGLVLCTPTATPPSWLIHRHPDMLMRDQYDRAHLGPRHYGCWNHPGYRALAERVITQLATRYADRPCLVGWQIDNEPNTGEVNGGNTFDYNPHTLVQWRSWLQQRYGTTAALNQAWTADFWSRAYARWDEVDPPRPKHGHVNPSAWLAWCRFRAQDLAGFVHWQRDLLRRLCPGVSVGTNIPECGASLMVDLAQDYWAQAEGLDWVGTDLYVFQRHPAREERALAYSCDLMRSAAGAARFIIMETQAGPHIAPWRVGFMGGHWGPEFLRRCFATYRRHGASGVCCFLWRPWRGGHEMGMNALADADGSATERTRALPGIIAEARDIVPTVAARRAVIHYSQASLMLGRHADIELVQSSTLPGWHALLRSLGMDVRFADSPRLAGMEWRAGDVLVLAYTTVLEPGDVAAVTAALAAGVQVVCGPGTGFFDHEGRLQAPRPAGGLDRLLGLRTVNCDFLAQQAAVQGNLDPVAAAVSGGAQVDASWRLGGQPLAGLVALVELQDAETVLAADGGQPLLLRRRSGAGSLLFCACDVGSQVRAESVVASALTAAVQRCLP